MNQKGETEQGRKIRAVPLENRDLQGEPTSKNSIKRLEDQRTLQKGERSLAVVSREAASANQSDAVETLLQKNGLSNEQRHL